MTAPPVDLKSNGKKKFDRMDRPTPSRRARGLKPVEGKYFLMKASCYSTE